MPSVLKQIKQLCLEGEYHQALSLAETLSAEEKEFPLTAMRIADCYYELGYYQKAIEWYSKVIESESLREIALYNRGLCYRELNCYDSALSDLMRVEGKYSDVAGTIGEILYYLGKDDSSRYTEALKYLNSCVAKNADDVDALYFIGACYNQLGQHEIALSMFRQCLDKSYSVYKVMDGVITSLNWLDQINELKVFARDQLNEETDPSHRLRDKAVEIVEDFEAAKKC
ncbi:MAG: tetratricopeptide repeat protein [Verrucomicrobiota bacterium]